MNNLYYGSEVAFSFDILRPTSVFRGSLELSISVTSLRRKREVFSSKQGPQMEGRRRLQVGTLRGSMGGFLLLFLQFFLLGGLACSSSQCPLCTNSWSQRTDRRGQWGPVSPRRGGLKRSDFPSLARLRKPSQEYWPKAPQEWERRWKCNACQSTASCWPLATPPWTSSAWTSRVPSTKSLGPFHGIRWTFVHSQLRPNLPEMCWLALGKTSSIFSLALGSLTLAHLHEMTFLSVSLPVGEAQKSVCPKWQRGRCPGSASSRECPKSNWQTTVVSTTQGIVLVG